MAPHAMDAPAESVYTSVAAVADLVRQDPAERGRAIRMEPKNRRLLSLMPFMQGRPSWNCCTTEPRPGCATARHPRRPDGMPEHGGVVAGGYAPCDVVADVLYWYK
jgi:hypothetical protein